MTMGIRLGPFELIPVLSTAPCPGSSAPGEESAREDLLNEMAREGMARMPDDGPLTPSEESAAKDLDDSLLDERDRVFRHGG